MTQTKPGRDMLATVWRGNCHICHAEFEMTGKEIDALIKGDHLTGISTIDCPACKARKKLYLRPESPAFPPPLPPTPEQIAAREAVIELRRERDEFRGRKLRELVAAPSVDPGIPGYIQVKVVHWFDDWRSDEDESMINVEEEFFRTEDLLLSVQVEVPRVSGFTHYLYGVAFGAVGESTTVEPFDELVRRVAAAQAHLTILKL